MRRTSPMLVTTRDRSIRARRRGTRTWPTRSSRASAVEAPTAARSVASLEDWFDPKRLRGDYVPTGWRGTGVTTRAVLGHDFGLDLSEADKRALIAFLRTL